MKYTRTNIPDVIICEPTILGDHRGYFTEAYQKKSFDEFIGHPVNFIQDNESKSSKNVLRGLHFQKGKFSQSKLVRVSHGKVLDVAVDIRKSAPTFGKYVSEILSSENKKQLFVPKGFAHGFVVLSDVAIFNYKVDAPYHLESEVGLAYNDADLNIDWQVAEDELILAEKDLKNPLLKNIVFEDEISYYE